MRKDIHIAVVCGGRSRESEVSRVSGRCVEEALEKTYRNVTLLELDSDTGKRLKEKNIDVVFPVLHGPLGEDGTFQGLLEILGIPYVGSGVLASACAMNKIIAKAIFEGEGLPIAPDVAVGRDLSPSVEYIVDKIGPDVIVKPVNQGSAIGISFCKGEKEIFEGIKEALNYDERVLVEKRIEGREITVGILERNGIEPLPVIEVTTPQGSWYDYEHRYTKGLSEHIIPAPLKDALYKRVQEFAVKAHKALFCRDFSRVDFIVTDGGEPIILEVNTIPGMTPTSLYPDAARAYGISFEQLVSYLVERALKRC